MMHPLVLSSVKSSSKLERPDFVLNKKGNKDGWPGYL